jgi:hypothetical protein
MDKTRSLGEKDEARGSGRWQLPFTVAAALASIISLALLAILYLNVWRVRNPWHQPVAVLGLVAVIWGAVLVARLVRDIVEPRRQDK